MNFIAYSLQCFLFSGFVMKACAGAGKYSKELNQNEEASHERDDSPFRKHKINLLWQKAKKRVEPSQWKDLFNELRNHDNSEMMLKKLRQDNGDPDGSKEAELRRQLQGIMTKYGVADVLPEKAQYTDGQRNNAITDEELQMKIFRNKNVAKLWEKARRGRFSEEELAALFEELQHHQEKVDEYHQLAEVLKEDSSENMVDKEAGEHGKNVERKKQARIMVENKHRDLKAEFVRLSALLDKNEKTKYDEHFSFENEKVQELWDQAKTSNFSIDELSSIQTELSHFEYKMNKLKQFTDDTEDGDKTSKKDDYKKTKEKEQKFKLKVDKLFRHLQDRIQSGSQHNEL